MARTVSGLTLSMTIEYLLNFLLRRDRMNACAEEYTDEDNSTQGVYPSGSILSIMHTALW